jgi:hypothetical protein
LWIFELISENKSEIRFNLGSISGNISRFKVNSGSLLKVCSRQNYVFHNPDIAYKMMFIEDHPLSKSGRFGRQYERIYLKLRVNFLRSGVISESIFENISQTEGQSDLYFVNIYVNPDLILRIYLLFGPLLEDILSSKPRFTRPRYSS